MHEVADPVEAAIGAQATRDLGGLYLPDTDAHILWAKGMTAPPEPKLATAPSGIDTKVEQPTLPPAEVFTPSGGARGAEDKAPSATPPRKPGPPRPEIGDERRGAGVDTGGAAAGPQRSALETAVLDEINRARGDPQHYVLKSYGFPRAQLETARTFLHAASPLAPLQLDDRLSAAAARQLADQGPRGEDNHTGSDGSTPMKRIQDAGFWSSVTAEVIAVGEPTEGGAVAQLLVDPPHRDALFDHLLRSAGVACGPNARFGSMCVVDMAGAPVPR
jgi:hypothetical protein